MKKLLCLALALVFTMGMLSGCQPTPDEDIVIGKDNDGWEDAEIAPSVVPEMNVPETWTKEVKRNDLEIGVDAEIDFPENSTFPVYVVKSRKFSQEDANVIMDALIGDAELYSIVDENTKAYIEEKIKYYTDELEHAIETNNEKNIEGYQEILQELMLEKEAAPDKESRVSVSREYVGAKIDAIAETYAKKVALGEDGEWIYEWTEKARERAKADGNTQIHGTCDLPSGVQADFSIQNCALSWYPSIVSLIPVKWPKCSKPIEENEAVSMGNAIMDKLGIEYQLTGAMRYDEDDNISYTLSYCTAPADTRRVDVGSMPETYFTEEEFNYPVMQEDISIGLNADGLISFQWNYPVEFVDVQTENTRLLPWDEVEGLIEKGLQIKNIRLYDDIEHLESYRLAVNKIVLSYMLVEKKDDASEMYYIPVWNVVGDMYWRFEDGYDPEKDEGGGYLIDENNEWPSFKNRCVLTINAIDGNIIIHR